MKWFRRVTGTTNSADKMPTYIQLQRRSIWSFTFDLANFFLLVSEGNFARDDKVVFLPDDDDADDVFFELLLVLAREPGNNTTIVH